MSLNEPATAVLKTMILEQIFKNGPIILSGSMACGMSTSLSRVIATGCQDPIRTRTISRSPVACQRAQPFLT
ncbi:tRNA A37 threonylcarbamoyladenosine biosynthesis protein TsaE [Azospirillum canadense]|nr:tRNA A37 threonylcarbamoyladenosine biosynthesis protein TsaE [Azospirillum canadense]